VRACHSSPAALTPLAQGYLALQWAALNNRVAAATILLERGADANAVDGQGQSALHWAAVRGAVPVAELLLRSGARLERADSRGYTAAHVAAQYGHTAVLYHFAVRWDANMDVLDGDGRSPCHWAAYKGFADSLRLLVLLEADLLRPDSEGCTPLHWAAIKGNAEATHLLSQAGGVAAMSAVDGRGATPAMLAQEKNHPLLASHLASAERAARQPRSVLSQRWLSVACAAGILALLVFYLNACLLAAALPPASGAASLVAYLVVSAVGAGLYFMYRASTRDPGVLRSGLESCGGMARAGPHAAARLDVPTLWAGNWGALCVSCKLVRPLGAKHCSVCNACVARFGACPAPLVSLGLSLTAAPARPLLPLGGQRGGQAEPPRLPPLPAARVRGAASLRGRGLCARAGLAHGAGADYRRVALARGLHRGGPGGGAAGHRAHRGAADAGGAQRDHQRAGQRAPLLLPSLAGWGIHKPL